MKSLTIGLLVVSLAILVARELRQNPSLPRRLAREIHRLVAGSLPPVALVPLGVALALVLLAVLFAVTGGP